MASPEMRKYHVGLFLIVCRGDDGKFHPETDLIYDAAEGSEAVSHRAAVRSALEVNEQFLKYGLVLRPGTDLNQFTYQANLALAQAAALAGKIVEARGHLDRAEPYAQAQGLGEFHPLRRNQILKLGMEKFLKLGGPDWQRLTGATGTDDLDILRAVAHKVAKNKNERIRYGKLVAKIGRAVRGEAPKVPAATPAAATAGKRKFEISLREAGTGETLVYSVVARTPREAGRLQSILERLSRREVVEAEPQGKK